ncbi:hypothetical protein [Saccharopolyspora spinosa]|uniref:Uncharacterized protein n=1 Tax=Saccharopolyspora spinosa TaxID=60894 RepID=A0A2N3Y1M6_SACSN|nr:hypothetical protein [Saccharopolyspora spinosa]PKW16809.1 hypothetical protein A8926_4698 [Saccharopolyspora spinosa]
MGLVKETQRSMYATVGAAAWMMDTMRTVPDQMGRAWQQRTQWMNRAGEAYEDLTERGQAVMGGARQEVQHRAGQIGEQARRIPGVARAEGAITGRVVDANQLPIADYDGLTAGEIVQRLQGLSRRELQMIAGYEKRNRARATVLHRIDELLAKSPAKTT